MGLSISSGNSIRDTFFSYDSLMSLVNCKDLVRLLSPVRRDSFGSGRPT